jgi:hypothetical protein
MTFTCRFVFAFVLVLGCSLPLCAATATVLEYRGFTIDESQVRTRPDLAGLRTAAKEQIDLVLAVGLPPEVIAFFQGIPFALVPAEAIRGSTPGVYDNRRVRVSDNMIRAGRKPVLLHEFMHAYHDQKLPQGTKNPDILAFFARAKSLGAYQAKSHMMENQGEFFACSATTYLFGVTAQEPFKRDKVRTTQPDLYAYLEKLFGPTTGAYAGVLPPARPGSQP